MAWKTSGPKPSAADKPARARAGHGSRTYSRRLSPIAALGSRLRWRLAHAARPVRVHPLPPDVQVDGKVRIRVRDGTRLAASLYRPASGGAVPAIVSGSPYGKDDSRGRHAGYSSLWFRAGILLRGLDFGRVEVSRGTSFEAPDPAFWVPRGYAVLHFDTRGAWKSEGRMGLFSQKDREDFHDVIEWTAAQTWCTGKVGACGVSYLAISQWFGASLAPPHLAAIIPWEGLSDVYRDCMYHGGIPQTGFGLFYFACLARAWNGRRPAVNPLKLLRPRQTCNAFWQERAAALEKIRVPALICASWSDHGLHTRGSFEGYRRIASEHKYLFNHGRKKWETFYSPEALEWQRRFLDHFLRDEPSLELPRARLEVRTRGEAHRVVEVDDFPVPGTDYQTLYLDGGSGQLVQHAPSQPHALKYPARKGALRFTHQFRRETLLVGNMVLRLRVSVIGHDDLDLFVGIKKRDPAGREVHFEGLAGHGRNIVSKGWLRVSQRALDPDRCLPDRPFHSHESIQKLQPGEIADVLIEILPSGTRFEKDSSLELVISGKDIVSHPVEHHMLTVNRGTHVVHTGGEHPAYLTIPDATQALSEAAEVSTGQKRGTRPDG